MTKNLRKRIIIVLMTLFTITLLGTLIAVNVLNYNVNLKHQRMAIRDDVRHYGVEVFCGQVKNNIKISEYDYCTCVVLTDNTVVVMSNQLPDYSSKEMKKITGELSHQNLSSGSYKDLVFVEADRKSGNRVYIFSDNRTAKENSKNFLIFSVIIFVIGLLILSGVAYLLSKWMIKPTEDSIKAEKEFMSNISHDLKTPITIIKANADMLEGEFGRNKQIEYIRQETAKMSSMVNETLTLLSIDSPVQQRVFEEFDLSSLLYEMVLPFESVAYENGITFDISIEDKIMLFGDSEQITRLISILMDNAMSYTNENGKVKISAFRTSSKIHLAFSNTGKEIPKEKREKIFRRFYRDNEERGGRGNHYGLGLAIAHSVVQLHHGKISVKCENGFNTFEIVLPAQN